LNEPWLQEAFLPAPVVGVYPNPAANKITLQVDEAQLGKNIRLIGSQGQTISVERITSMQQTFLISHLKPGIYFLKGEGIHYKFIKL
jgi:hypothetical protein